MALPKLTDADLPIANVPVSGPAVDRLRNRKEQGTTERFTEEEFDRNWLALRERVIAGTKRLLAE